MTTNSRPARPARLALADGTIFEGIFVAGQRDGEGTLTLPDARRFRSVWKEGREVVREPLDVLIQAVIQ